MTLWRHVFLGGARGRVSVLWLGAGSKVASVTTDVESECRAKSLGGTGEGLRR